MNVDVYILKTKEKNQGNNVRETRQILGGTIAPGCDEEEIRRAGQIPARQ